MYVRFVSPRVECARTGALGLLRTVGWAQDELNLPNWLDQALERECKWFNENLEVPTYGAFRVRSRGRYLPDGISWFRDDAHIMFKHAYQIKYLLAEIGVPIVRLWTDRPGQILYWDNIQIVAKPSPDTPIRWRYG